MNNTTKLDKPIKNTKKLYKPNNRINFTTSIYQLNYKIKFINLIFIIYIYLYLFIFICNKLILILIIHIR